MIVEQRLRWFDQVFHDIYERADIISFGSEGCPGGLPDRDSYDAITELLDRYHILPKLVTPRVSQYELPKVLQLLEHICMKNIPLEIVVNDWGILFYCLKKRDIFKIHLGRQLCRSLVDSPWADYIRRKEKDEVREWMKGHPYDDSVKLDLLKEWGIKGLELNSWDGLAASIENLLAAGLTIALEPESYLLTVGRVCLAKRICREQPCSGLCGLAFAIEPEKKWLGPLKNQVDLEEIEQKALRGMMVTGNRVLMEHKAKLPLDVHRDKVVVIISDPKSLDHIV